MGFGEYTSANAEEEFESVEIEREAWEMRHCPDGTPLYIDVSIIV